MERLRTRFEVDEECPLSEYPRPMMRRDNYTMLNGVWQYAVRRCDEALGDTYDGEILVPFAVETLLSKVMHTLTPDEVLYYHRTFDYIRYYSDRRVLLHFDAVDYEATVTLNGVVLGTHRGGYLPFVYDITDIISDKNTLDVMVVDPTDNGVQARGKQRLDAGGIFYTPTSGIWQSVWIEEVNARYIEWLHVTPDIDTKSVDIALSTAVTSGKATVSLRGEEVACVAFSGEHVGITLSDMELWLPESPVLYDLVIEVDGDRVESYFAMRAFTVEEDRHGVKRFCLNHEPYFLSGVLDQGYWSDGMLTPPSDEAMIYDIESMKTMGFNMLRKHIKIEPLRWYYHCDRLGMIVWQDFVNGGGAVNVPLMSMLGNFHAKIDDSRYKFFHREDEAGRCECLRDADATVAHLYSVPCIAEWTPFNEGWCQFDARAMAERVRALDRTRPIDHASGWFDQGVGDFRSLHVYFMPIRLPRDTRCIAVTEFGGYSLAVEGHMYAPKHAFGYKRIKDKAGLTKALRKLYARDIERNIERGLSVAIYTQLSDVENEINGLVTYDRAVEKVARADMHAINDALYAEFRRVTR